MAEVLIAVAISAAVSAASAAVQYVLTPKPKPVVRGRLTGDVTLQDSAYGVVINEVYGGLAGADASLNGVKVSGNIIWPPNLNIRKVTTTTKGGGKGAKTPDQVNISYFTDVAISFGRGEMGLLELWANTTLIFSTRTQVTGVYVPTSDPNMDYGSVGDLVGHTDDIQTGSEDRYNGAITVGADGTASVQLADGSMLRWYSGTNSQPVDSLVQSETDGRLGAGMTPAYRGRAYAVIENIPYSKYSGVPNYRAVLVNLKAQNFNDIVLDLATRSDLSASEIDNRFLGGINVRGYLRAGRQAGREDVDTLARVFNLETADVNGKIAFVPRGAGVPVTIPSNEIGAIEGAGFEGNEPISEILRTITDPRERPRRMDLRFIDPARNHDYNDQSDFMQVAGSQREETIDAPVTLLATEARQIASRELFALHFESDPVRFTLSWKYAWLVPTQPLWITDGGEVYRFRIQEIQGAVPSAVEIVAVPEEPSIFFPASEGVSGEGGTTTLPIPATSAVEFIDVATLRDVDDDSGMYVGLGPITTGGWQSANLYRQNGTDWELIESFTTAAKLGYASTVLVAPGCADVWDRTNTVRVVFFSDLSTLENKTELEVLNGANGILFGNEVLQFASAIAVSGQPRTYDLSVLLRGRKGTEWAMGSHAINERVVLLDDAIRFIPRPLTDRNVAATYKAVSSGQILEDQGNVSFTYAGNNLKPLSVAQIRGTRDGSNNLTITWYWRTRVGGQWLDNVDASFVEAAHAYEIEVMDGVTLKRTIAATTESASYTAAEQTTDGFTPGNAITVRIYQLSGKVGRGFVKEVTV